MNTNTELEEDIDDLLYLYKQAENEEVRQDARDRVKALILKREREAKLKSQIRCLTLKARYQKVFLGGDDDALKTKRYVKSLKQQLKQSNPTEQE